MNVFLRLTDRLCTYGENLAIVLLYGIAALMLAEVCARSFLQASISFSWEYSAYGMAAAFFLGMGSALRAGSHIRVMFLRDALPSRYRLAMDVLATCAGLALSGVIVYSLAKLVARSVSRELVSTMVSQTPLAIPQAIVLAGAILMLLAFVARLIRQLTGQAPELAPPGGESP